MMIIKKNKFVATLVTSALLLNSAIGINVVKAAEIPTISYSTHVQSYGWQDYKTDGEMSGTSGQSKRLEAIKIKTNDSNLNVEYSTHIQGIGWQDFVSNDALSGTSGQAKRLEAIKIRLTGVDAEKYDVYYRVHAQHLGWLDWAKNGEEAGTSGLAYRLEAIEIKLVEKGSAAPGATTHPYEKKVNVSYQTHVQSYGWQNYVSEGKMAGTSGKAKRLEAIKIKLDDNSYGGIEYSTHVQSVGWQKFVSNDALSGTSGKGLRLEAIKIKLTGSMVNKYDVYYRVHAQHFGWMGWAKNGQAAGTEGYGYRLEGIEIKLVAKGNAAPRSNANYFSKNVIKAGYNDGALDAGYRQELWSGVGYSVDANCFQYGNSLNQIDDVCKLVAQGKLSAKDAEDKVNKISGSGSDKYGAGYNFTFKEADAKCKIYQLNSRLSGEQFHNYIGGHIGSHGGLQVYKHSNGTYTVAIITSDPQIQ